MRTGSPQRGLAPDGNALCGEALSAEALESVEAAYRCHARFNLAQLLQGENVPFRGRTGPG